MSLLAMPMLLVNLGCEMLYILDQRLKAQNIAADKSCRVLHDVVRTMFDPEYVTKIFSPQEVYSVSSTRKIFERLAHSSIMRLSESSMEKLFDLMLMGFKYQVHCSEKLTQMMDVTQLHLTTIRTMMAAISDASIVSMVDNVERLMKETYGSMSQGQLHLLRQTLQRYFQDKRVKVSLFLQEGIQSSSGRLILPTPFTSQVGSVAYLDTAGRVTSRDQAAKKPAVEPHEFFVHPTPLGTNLYDKERIKVVPPARSFDPPAATTTTSAAESKGSGGGAAGGVSSAYAEEVMEKGGREARKELDLLTFLLSVPSKNQAPDNFKLNLFNDDDSMPSSGKGSGGGHVLDFGDSGHAAYKNQVMSGLKSMSVKDKGGADDLLDLMDNA